MVDAAAERKTGAEDITWDLSVYYASLDDPRIEEDLQRVQQRVTAFAETYRGQVAELSAAELVTAHQEIEEIYEIFGRIEHFAFLNFSVYTNDPKWGAFLQRITEEDSQLQQQLVFFDLEWNQVPDEQAQAILQDPVLGKYAHHLEAERRRKPYQLSEAEEKILLEKNVTGNSAWNRLFEQLMSAMSFDYEGEEKNLEEVLTMLRDENREIRRKAADSLTAGLRAHQMQLTFIFNVLAADKASDDRLRGYESWITSRNLANKASDEVVNALIESVTSSYDLVARHYKIKRVLMGLDELYDYDRYAPLNLKESETFYTWDQARQIVVNAYRSFAERAGEVADRFFADRWIHAPVMQGKRGGAFATPGTKGSHPWVFVNYKGKADDVMTLAHELGHGLHMYLSAEEQPLQGIHTPLTTAEMASTFGEMLVFQDLMAKEEDKEVKLSMLAEKIEGTFATVFRQVSMNRFEDGMHTARRTEGELSTERLSEIWMETQKAMFQDSVTMRDDYGLWWSYVPHFLAVPGYVYAYAFGELLVLALYNLYENQGADFVPKYIQLLADGNSDYPEKLLAKVGVDLNDPDFWNQGIALLRDFVDQEEALAKELFPDKF